MSSGFVRRDAEEGEGRRMALPCRGSSRYRHYKERMYGALHFVKAPAPGYEDDLLTVESLRKEFLVGYGLIHPNVAAYLRYEGGAVYEEYIDGQTLREMMDAGDPRLDSPGFVAGICRGILCAVGYLHSRGIIHNDLKPENVMVTRVGEQVKVIDLSAAETAMLDTTPGFTEAYKAPEQGADATAGTTPATDLYHVGRIMEELTAGRRTARRWKGFIRRATATVPTDRFNTAAEAEAAIPPSGRPMLRLLVPIGFVAAVATAIWLWPIASAPSADSLTADSMQTSRGKETVVITDTVYRTFDMVPATPATSQAVAAPKKLTYQELWEETIYEFEHYVDSVAHARIDPFHGLMNTTPDGHVDEYYPRYVAAFEALEQDILRFSQQKLSRHPELALDLEYWTDKFVEEYRRCLAWNLHIYYNTDFPDYPYSEEEQ